MTKKERKKWLNKLNKPQAEVIQESIFHAWEVWQDQNDMKEAKLWYLHTIAMAQAKILKILEKENNLR